MNAARVNPMNLNKGIVAPSKINPGFFKPIKSKEAKFKTTKFIHRMTLKKYVPGKKVKAKLINKGLIKAGNNNFENKSNRQAKAQKIKSKNMLLNISKNNKITKTKSTKNKKIIKLNTLMKRHYNTPSHKSIKLTKKSKFTALRVLNTNNIKALKIKVVGNYVAPLKKNASKIKSKVMKVIPGKKISNSNDSNQSKFRPNEMKFNMKNNLKFGVIFKSTTIVAKLNKGKITRGRIKANVLKKVTKDKFMLTEFISKRNVRNMKPRSLEINAVKSKRFRTTKLNRLAKITRRATARRTTRFMRIKTTKTTRLTPRKKLKNLYTSLAMKSKKRILKKLTISNRRQLSSSESKKNLLPNALKLLMAGLERHKTNKMLSSGDLPEDQTTTLKIQSTISSTTFVPPTTTSELPTTTTTSTTTTTITTTTTTSSPETTTTTLTTETTFWPTSTLVPTPFSLHVVTHSRIRRRTRPKLIKFIRKYSGEPRPKMLTTLRTKSAQQNEFDLPKTLINRILSFDGRTAAPVIMNPPIPRRIGVGPRKKTTAKVYGNKKVPLVDYEFMEGNQWKVYKATHDSSRLVMIGTVTFLSLLLVFVAALVCCIAFS